MEITNLDTILEKRLHDAPITGAEILYLLELTDSRQREKLFSMARILRSRYFEDKVFLYGFVYFSTYCRNDCTFCYYRKSNSACTRYRKTNREIVDIACALAETGVHLIDLTMGEDPYYLANSVEGHKRLVEIVDLVKSSTRLPIMISPGMVPKKTLIELKNAGANWYACYQETHNYQLYEKLRLNQSYEERWAIKVFARQMGMLVEEGLLVGVGDSPADITHSLLEMSRLGAQQVRTMSFVPQQGTPLYNAIAINNSKELNIIAVMRLLFPDKLIPASLDVEGVLGLKQRLDAGANVITSLIPSEGGLVGVSQSTLDISEGNRTVQGILPILKDCGLIPATLAEYVGWLEKQQGQAAKEEVI
ncbi:MAG TPA: methylornithine synthase PylB [Negativicutes bacterium]